MTVEPLLEDDDMVASPIEHDDLSTSQLETTHLSLPDSFDESLCLDLYNDFIRPKRTGVEIRNDQVDSSRSFPFAKTTHGMDRNELGSSESNQKRRDDRRKTSPNCDSKVDTLRSELQHKRMLHQSSVAEQRHLERQIEAFKQKTQLMGVELANTRKEASIFLRRAENAEKKFEEERLRTNAKREEVQAQYERDLSRIREDFTLEIASSRAHQNEAYARESKLLFAARDQAIEHAKRLQHELSELREDREKKEAESLDIIKELERQLANVRSDLKVKSFELNSLVASHDRTTVEATKSNTELTKCKDSLAQLQKEFSELQMRSIKLEEANRQKDDALQIYHHEDLLFDCDTENNNSNKDKNLSQRKSLVKNSIALARKCRELQAMMKTQGNELSIERNKNAVLSQKIESNQQLFKELSLQSNKNASAYIISTVQERDREIFNLNSKITALEGNLKTAAKERDDLSTQLSNVLERRDQLNEMKALMETMRRESMTSVRPICCGITHSIEKVENHDAPDNEDDDDLLEHMVHHSSLMPISKRIL